jgi:tRNA/tmRNA/rRNA uracil-C5-methylase (TrmA/RlmC/RlmD family)
VTNEIVITLVGRKAYFNELGDDARDATKTFNTDLYEANLAQGFDNCEKETIAEFQGNKTFDNVIKTWFATQFEEKFNANEALKGFKLAGLNFLNSDQSSDSVPFVQDSEMLLLAGTSKVYHEKICGNMFEVSNSSFLQINTPQMNKMYTYVGDLAKLDENTVLLDICSGIGTIGLSVGANAKKIIGIEMVESSCENAKKNAANCTTGNKYEVICSKVEDVIDRVIAENPSARVVGILDPPRAGLHPSVIKTLRTCKGLNELVFMACDVKQSKRNILDFCLPESKKRRGPPFTPIISSGVDMFPNSPHFETIFYLKRGTALTDTTPAEKIEPEVVAPKV